MLEVLVKVGEAQQRAGDIASNDPESDQLAQGELTLQHQIGTNAEHREAGGLVKELGEAVGAGGCDGIAEAFGHIGAVALLPAPTGFEFEVLGFHRLNAGEHLHQMVLGFGVEFGFAAQLAADHRRGGEGEQAEQGRHKQGHDREHPAVEEHHDDVDHREHRIEHYGEGGAGEEGADLFEFTQA